MENRQDILYMVIPVSYTHLQSQIPCFVVFQQCPHLVTEQKQRNTVEEYREGGGNADDGPEQARVRTGEIDEGAHTHHGQREDDGKCPMGDFLGSGPFFEQELQHVLVVEVPGARRWACWPSPKPSACSANILWAS